jgi:hypothetical protein
MLRSNRDAEMLWILRQYGTHLYPVQCGSGHEAAYYRQVIRYWSGDHKLNLATQDEDRARFYIVTGAGIRQLSADEACQAVDARTTGMIQQEARL